MEEYERKKEYENNKTWTRMQKFKKENCAYCKNKNTNLCEIRRNIYDELQCAYKEL